jgi:hypothetical protein
MTLHELIKTQMDRETRARLAAEERERLAIIRAERAETDLWRLTIELDRAHRLIDAIKAEVLPQTRGTATTALQ